MIQSQDGSTLTGEPRLANGLSLIAAEAGVPSDDLSVIVHSRARVVRRRRIAVAGVAIVGIFALPGTALAITKPWKGGDRLVVATSPSISASALAETSASPEPTAAPASPPAAPPAAAVSPRVSTSARAVAARLRLSVVASDPTPRVGQIVNFRLRWSDGDGRFGGITSTWGADQGGGTGGVAVSRCAESPTPRSGTETLSHSWAAPGRYLVELGVTTYDCLGNLETRTVTVSVVVTGTATAPVTPSPGADPPPGVL